LRGEPSVIDLIFGKPPPPSAASQWKLRSPRDFSDWLARLS
jgi:hypothetical protein